MLNQRESKWQFLHTDPPSSHSGFLNYISLMFLDMANAVLLPLMYSTPLEYGGLGLTPFYISTALGCFGIINAIFQAKFLGNWTRNLGRRRLYQFGILSVPVSFSMFSIMKYFAQKAGGVGTLVWICIVVHLASEAGSSWLMVRSLV